VRPALEASGVKLEFWRVAMKPGKPLAVGRRDRAIVVGLPGNPASAMVTFALIVLPLIRAMQGDRAPLPNVIRMKTARAIAHEPGRTEFVRARVVHDASGVRVTTLGNQSSGAITTMAEADALVRIPAESSGIDEGAEVDVFLASELGT
jgi:molybdopterin molybdotransferase